MSIKLNSVDITSNKLNSVNVTIETLNGNTVWPTESWVTIKNWGYSYDGDTYGDARILSNTPFRVSVQEFGAESITMLESSIPNHNQTVSTLLNNDLNIRTYTGFSKILSGGSYYIRNNSSLVDGPPGMPEYYYQMIKIEILV